MVLISYLIVILALTAGTLGVYLMARSLSRQERVFDRRLAEPTQAAVVRPRKQERAQVVAPGARNEGAVAQLIDKYFPAFRQRVEAARAPFTPTQLVAASFGLFATLFLTLLVLSIPLLLALALAAWGGILSPMLLISFLANRRRALFSQQMPQTVDLIARSLQAGHPVTTAMGVAAHQMPDPIGPEFSLVIGEMNAGLDRDTALRNLLLRFPIPELRMFTASLEVTRETGGNVAEVLLKLGDAMRSKAQLRKKVEAISAEGRLSFWVVSALPIAVVAVLMLLRPEYYSEVSSDPLFWRLMMVPPVLWMIGALSIWRMINFKI
jgi:tight adherence protein B